MDMSADLDLCLSNYTHVQVDKMEAERRDQEEARDRARDKKRHKKLTQENLPQVR